MSEAESAQCLADHFPAASDWAQLLAESFSTETFESLQQTIAMERETETVFPEPANVYNAFRLSSFANTKVVILGQDPYHGVGQAHGLSFSVLGDQKLPPSLKNIFKEVESDVGCQNTQGNLTAWAEQGVLLLNTVLTVRSGQANSHRKLGWEPFTDQVIELLGQRAQPLVFILWGKPASAKRKWIGEHHCLIESPHPSPLSAYRGFFDSKPFSRTNTALEQWGLKPIDWQL